jgi:tRNA (guanosine-2'-O-)-methyltransferase
MREVTERRKKKIISVLSKRQKDLTLIIDNIHDPHNVSAILRSCDAFGVYKIHLYYTTEEFPELGKKSSASAIKWVEREKHRDAKDMIMGLKEQGFHIIRTGFSENARPLGEWDLTIPTAIILGNEHRGLSPELCELVEDELYIPMQGMVESFNVSVAAAIILYESWRQRSLKGMYNSPSFDEEESEEEIGEESIKKTIQFFDKYNFTSNEIEDIFFNNANNLRKYL